MAVAESGPLTLSQLEAHLWRSADLFRNKVSNQKDYILALLFFKRASDIYDEDTEKALEKLKGVPNAEVLAQDRAWHPIVVPPEHSWDKVRNTDEAKLGQALNDALRAVAAANQKQLAGVFDHTDFNNKQALPNEDLAEILDHFHDLGLLTNARVSQDMLGQAYEWLIA
jgi:type I restriction enzyme M protein